MKIAITGSIASGKSLVTSYLQQKKYEVIDADKIGHNILLDDLVKYKIVAAFSDSILTDNIIDRKKLGNIVFKNKEKLHVLNEITHPRIREIIVDNFKKSKNNLIFLDIALLYECNFQDLVDKVIVVNVSDEIQLSRLMNRNNFTKEEAMQRISKQMSNAEKIKLGDFIIDNNGTKEQTYKQVDEILKKLKG